MGSHTGIKNINCKCTCILTIILTYNNYKQAMFLILGGPERWCCETETSGPVITFLCIYKRVVSDEKYYIYYLPYVTLQSLSTIITISPRFILVIKLPSSFLIKPVTSPYAEDFLVNQISRNARKVAQVTKLSVLTALS